MNIEGKLIEKFDTQSIKETFRKREFVIEYAENPQYPEYVKFELIQNNCDLLDSVNIGDVINISFNLKGRKWTNPKGEVAYFNTLQAWRIENRAAAPASSAANDAPPPPAEEPGWVQDGNDEAGDLPF